MIDVEDLVKDYGTVVAVRGLSFRIGAGEVVGFLGPNGAGKTTTLRILSGFLPATSGRVRIGGHDIRTDALAARSRLGYLPESAPSYPELRVREYLLFRARLKRVPRKRRADALEQAMAEAGVASMADTLIGHLSKGYRQRLGLADALLGSPPLLILDEPTAGLDPNQILEIRALVRALGKAHTVLLSTHILSEVEATCDRAIVIAKGRLVAEGSVDALRASPKREAALLVRDPDGLAPGLLAEDPRLQHVAVEAADGLVRLVLTFAPEADAGTALEAAVARLVRSGVAVREATLRKVRLEEVFGSLTRAGRSDAPAPEATP